MNVLLKKKEKKKKRKNGSKMDKIGTCYLSINCLVQWMLLITQQLVLLCEGQLLLGF